jgi:hypothetical protein
MQPVELFDIRSLRPREMPNYLIFLSEATVPFLKEPVSK